jgi:peptidoglycan/LPS O-acetylase OafA/YrhL
MNYAQRIHILDPLRGLAALWVVLFHYSGSILPTITPNALTGFFSYGYLGIHAFFVISGFVIPYSLGRLRYQFNHFGRFILRRWVRIAPPAYLAALLVIAFNLLAIALTGKLPDNTTYPGLSPKAIFANLAFLVPYTHVEWYNFVYWTLTVEFEFYLVIGIIFPALVGKWNSWLQPLLILIILLTSFIDGPGFFRFNSLFILGLLLYLLQAKVIRPWLFAFLTVWACITCYSKEGPEAAIVAVITASVIMMYHGPIPKSITWLGSISYSLYITHVPTGYFAEAIVKRIFPLELDGPMKIIFLFVYTGLSLFAAWIFYERVEKPCQRWSQALRRNHS